MLYVGKSETSAYNMYVSKSYSWAFGLDLAGCILSIVAAIVVAISNRPDATNATPAGTVYYPVGSVQGGQTVVVQQGQSYPPPAGSPYPYQPAAGVGGYPQAYAAGAPPPYPSAAAPPQGYWGAAPQEGVAPQGYSGYNYAQGYSGQSVPQQGMEKTP